MPRHRQLIWASLSTVAVVLMTVSMVMAVQDPPQQAGNSAAQDPFDTAEKAASGVSEKDPFGAAGKSPGTSDKADEKKAEKKAEPEFVRKTQVEWQRILPRGVFEVTRLKATEPAFTGRYATGHFHGTFVCACCNAELFSSQHKFDSGTGWPSFWQPVKGRAIDRALDNTEAEPRIEVMCHRCGAHLGHVFDDGPPPTGLRFCINSLSLKLKAPEGDTAQPAMTKGKAKVKTTRATRSSSGSRMVRNKGTARPTEPGTPGPSNEETAGSKPPGTGKTGGV